MVDFLVYVAAVPGIVLTSGINYASFEKPRPGFWKVASIWQRLAVQRQGALWPSISNACMTRFYSPHRTCSCPSSPLSPLESRDAPRQLVPMVTFTNENNSKMDRVKNRMLFNGAASKIIYWLKFGFNCSHSFSFYSFFALDNTYRRHVGICLISV